MLPDDVTARLSAVRAALKPETELGFHGHHNLGRRGMVGGQEDMIEDTALTLARQRGLLPARAA